MFNSPAWWSWFWYGRKNVLPLSIDLIFSLVIWFNHCIDLSNLNIANRRSWRTLPSYCRCDLHHVAKLHMGNLGGKSPESYGYMNRTGYRSIFDVLGFSRQLSEPFYSCGIYQRTLSALGLVLHKIGVLVYNFILGASFICVLVGRRPQPQAHNGLLISHFDIFDSCLKWVSRASQTTVCSLISL